MVCTVCIVQQHQLLGKYLNYKIKPLQGKKKNSRIQETQNIWTDAERRRDTEKNIEDFFFLFKEIYLGGGAAAVHSTAKHWSTFLSIVLHCTHFHCSAIPWTALNFTVYCLFEVHCNVLDCTDPPTMNSNALQLVKFFQMYWYYKDIYNIITLLF